jgi:hypothetical protein
LAEKLKIGLPPVKRYSDQIATIPIFTPGPVIRKARGFSFKKTYTRPNSFVKICNQLKTFFIFDFP